MLGLDKEKSDPANMIIKNMAVGPPPIRPSVQVTGSMQRGDDDLTIIYNKIIKQNNEIKRCFEAGNNETSIKELRKGLQFYCAALMSNNTPGTTLKHKSG
jgi:DNA-directed RNA polymerase II subunit RPB1